MLVDTWTCRRSKLKGPALVLFQNTDCRRRFGIPRSESACCSLVSPLADDHNTWNDWELEILRVYPI